jgi:transcription-repair coupling factor (superfamily II helicase)
MEELFRLLTTDHERLSLNGLQGASPAYVASQAAAKTGRPLLYVAPSERLAELAVQDISLFSPLPVILYPGFDIPPYTPLSPDQATVADRISVLYHLLTANKPLILVASCESLLRRVMPKGTLGSLAELIIRGEEVEQKELIRSLIRLGYENVSLVQATGDFSVRGGIVDIFPPGFEAPLRLDFFGDTVESLRSFDPISQRSIAEKNEAVILPASNILFPPAGSPALAGLISRFRQEAEKLDWPPEQRDVLLEKIRAGQRFPGIEFFLPLFYNGEQGCLSPLHYLPENAVVFIADAVETGRSFDLAWERIEANYLEAVNSSTPAIVPGTVFVPPDDLSMLLDAYTRIRVVPFPEMAESDEQSISIVSTNHQLLLQKIEM